VFNSGCRQGWLHYDLFGLSCLWNYSKGRAHIYVLVEGVFVRQCVDAVKEEGGTYPRCRAEGAGMLMLTVSIS
jgi:hypothetical protein